ncbi:hypothetical protein [Guyparkeria halopsychrophila]|uniref:hypothetical protein n=1 Tax=Guyparkeria halopsychrophila TaxID=3139421 RepID=UPI0037CA1A71
MIFGSNLRDLADSLGAFEENKWNRYGIMIHIFLKRIAMLLALAGSLTLLAGCNTMEGLGQDTQELGDSIEGEAQDHD